MPKITYICANPYCKKSFQRLLSTTRDSGIVCCSVLCQHKWQSIVFKGKNNPNYRTGKHLEITCSCGNPKDFRAKLCAGCAKRSFLKKGAISTRPKKDELLHAVKTSSSFLDAAQKAKVSRHVITVFAKKHSVDVSHFSPGRGRFLGPDVIFNERIHRNNSVKSFLLRNKLIKNECSDCGQKPVWNKKPLTLQLHHKNGDSKDNKFSNLCLLCPNCHTQTDSFTGSNTKGIKKKR
jgi:hypothetical protein